MRFCQPHWDKLREAIDVRGLMPATPKSGAAAAAKIADQFRAHAVTRENFDPLMGAHFAIAGNIMEYLGRAGGARLALSTLGDVCPVCHINRLHKESCTDPKCKLDKEAGYDWMIDKAADEQLAEGRRLGLVPPPS